MGRAKFEEACAHLPVHINAKFVQTCRGHQYPQLFVNLQNGLPGSVVFDFFFPSPSDYLLPLGDNTCQGPGTPTTFSRLTSPLMAYLGVPLSTRGCTHGGRGCFYGSRGSLLTYVDGRGVRLSAGAN